MPEQETGLIVVDVKKILSIAGIALVLFFVIAQPGQAANLVGNIVDFLRSSAEAVITFVSNVFNG
ncbi:hypothetical protein SAMN05421835_11667 [Amycolatopsis sacchari]|uniref:Uncharacterized protein n=2 Tax=Amycolatopsis TaxID=1813 RepID=A0A1I3XW02_9PSEU|nr:hypothetical protein SAMN05421835_11667 [Amycolatopsis sacchari]